MKYAFVFGSSAFIVPGNTVSYGNEGNERNFLKINSIYHDKPATEEETHLEIDLNIKDTNGSAVIIVSNKPVTGSPYTIKKERNNIEVLRLDGSTLIQVHQLDDVSAMKLEHNIVAELEVNSPLAVIRVTGEFLVDSLHIRAENEKLMINDNGYATAALAGKNLVFTTEGVTL